MRNSGIIRRVDDLSRITIPLEIRKMLGIANGEPLEIYVDYVNKGVYYKKITPETKAIDTLDSVINGTESLPPTAVRLIEEAINIIENSTK